MIKVIHIYSSRPAIHDQRMNRIMLKFFAVSGLQPKLTVENGQDSTSKIVREK